MSWYERFREQRNLAKDAAFLRRLQSGDPDAQRGTRRKVIYVDDEGVTHPNWEQCRDANREANVGQIGITAPVKSRN